MMTHDYKRHGTTTLFAALDVKSRKVIGECLPRHPLPGSGLPAKHARGAKEFLEFLCKIDKTVPARRDVHLILDSPLCGRHRSEAHGGRHSQDARRSGVAGQAPALQAAFHPHQRLMAEPGRTVPCRDHVEAHPAR